MKKIFYWVYFSILLIAFLPVPAFAHGGAIGLFEGVFSLLFLGLAFIFFIVGFFVQDFYVTCLFTIFNAILLILSIILAVHSSRYGLKITSNLVTSIWAGFNMFFLISNFSTNEMSEEDNKEYKENKDKTADSLKEEKLSSSVTEENEKGGKVSSAVSEENNNGVKTPLMIAVENNYKNIVGALIDDGAVINAKDSEGKTALIWAALYGYDEIAKILLKKGADKNIKDNSGNTYEDYAKKKV